MEPLDLVPSLSQSVHGNDIKVEQTSISGNSDNNLVNAFPGIQADSLSFLAASIAEPITKKQCLSDPDIEIIILGTELSDLHINLAQRILKNNFLI